jgi:hypothetical protein
MLLKGIGAMLMMFGAVFWCLYLGAGLTQDVHIVLFFRFAFFFLIGGWLIFCLAVCAEYSAEREKLQVKTFQKEREV